MDERSGTGSSAVGIRSGGQRGEAPLGTVAARMTRVIARDRCRELPSSETVLVTATLIGSIVFGTWWTASAALAGNTVAFVLRFGLSVTLGLYYVALCAFVRR